MFAVVDAGLGAEGDVAEAVAIAAREAAVIPRTHDEHVDGGRAVLLHEVVLAEQALRIFGVVPAAHEHDGGLDVLQVFPDGAGLPDFVVGGVVDVQVPERLLVLEVLFVGVGERAHLQVEIVAVGRAELEGRGGLGQVGLVVFAGAEAHVEVEAVGEHEGAVVIGVVAHVVIGDGGLRGDGDERGVGVDHAGGGVEAGLRDAVHADFGGVVGNVLDEPVDGVVGVGALVGIFGAALDRLVGADDDVIAFAHVAAADVLVGEDEFFAGEEFGGAEGGAVLVGAVGRDVVAGALEHDGVGLVVGEGVLGDVDGGEELDAVAHGDAVFELGVVLADEIAACGGGGGGGGGSASLGGQEGRGKDE